MENEKYNPIPLKYRNIKNPEKIMSGYDEFKKQQILNDTGFSLINYVCFAVISFFYYQIFFGS